MMTTALLLALLTGTVTGSGENMDLSGWVAMALDNSPAISSSEASLLSAEASFAGAESFLYPSLTATAGASRMWADSWSEEYGVVKVENDRYSAGLTLSQELLQSGGQNWLYRSASELTLLAVQADHQSTVLEVMRSVADSYYSVLEALQLKCSAETAHQRSLNQLQRTEQLYAIGAVTTLDLLQVQVQESADRLAVSRSSQRVLTAYTELYVAAGVDVAVCDLAIDTNAVLHPVSERAAESLSLDISRNPDLQAARFREKAAEKRYTASGRSYWPSLRASAGWSWQDGTLNNIDHMFDNDSYNVGLSLSWSIFDGFQRESGINSARASHLSAASARESMENSLEASVHSLKGNLLTDIQYYEDSKLMLEQAEERYRLSLSSYEIGALTLLELLDAQADLASAEANLVTAGVNALKTEASLLVQLGRPPRTGE